MNTPLRRRLFSVLLSLVMLASLLPTSILAAGEDTEPGASAGLSRLSEAPADGSTVSIYHPNSKKMLSSEASGSRLAAVSAEPSDGSIAQTADMALLTVAVTEGVYTFALDGKYLTSGATGNALSYSSELSDLGRWKLEAQADGTWYLMNVGANYQGNYNQALEYYNGFTTYGVKADNNAYKFDFYAPAAAAAVDPVSGLRDGAAVAICNDGNGKALTAAASGSKLVGADAALNEKGELTGEGIPLLTIEVGDGYVAFRSDGKYLTAGETGSSLTFAETDSGLAHWIVEEAPDGLFFLRNAAAAYNGNPQYLEYYNGFTSYGKSATAKPAAYAMSFRQLGEADDTPPAEPVNAAAGLEELTEGGTVLIYNPSRKTAISAKPNGDWYLKASPVTLGETGAPASFTADLVWTISVRDGVYTFTNGDAVIGCWPSGSYAELTVNKRTDTDEGWKLTAADAAARTFFLGAAALRDENGKPAYIQGNVNNGTERFRGTFTTNPNDACAMQFYLVDPANAAEEGGIEWDKVLNKGDRVVIYNDEAKGCFGVDSGGLGTSLDSVPTELRGGLAYPANGAYLFTVDVVKGYYTFAADGKYLASNDKEALFFQEEPSANAQWYLTGRDDGYILYNASANYNGTPVCVESFSGAFSGWTFKADSAALFVMRFLPIAADNALLGDAVNNARVVFTGAETVVKNADYKGEFTLDDLTPLAKIASVTAVCNGEPVALAQDGKGITFTIPGAVTGASSELALSVAVSYAEGGGYGGAMVVAVKDVPLIGGFSPAPNSETGKDVLQPTIRASVQNAPDGSAVAMTVGGVAVEAALVGGVVSYTPAEPLKAGRTTVSVRVTRADSVTGEAVWTFTVGEASETLYFGQLHSHTAEYSDGAGSLSDALSYISALPDSANVDFVAFTDHSNYFDSTAKANPEGALYDMSLASEESRAKWERYTTTARAFNEEQGAVVALPGFEMTWSGGPGHINTWATPGIVSRNNTTLNNKTNDAGMKAYYALLSQPEGEQSISQFNHPGKTFGNFSDFNYWDPVIDSRVYTVEVGNGEGPIGQGGYYPSYEQYTMALDKGWHIAPTNNQDNHKGRWGNANDARDVVLTDDFSEQGIYDAIRALRVYATEDKNLEVYYHVNGLPMGSIINDVPEELELSVQVSDPDRSDAIAKVEVIVNSSKVACTWDNEAQLAAGTLSAKLAPDYSYYYIRVTETDGDIAVTAPVWVGETLKLGISAFTCGTAMPVTDEELTLTATLFNSEAADATVKSVVYTANGGSVIGTDTATYTVPASGMTDVTFRYTPTLGKVMTVTATVVLEQNGKEFTFTKDIVLDVQNAEELVYVGIDAAHYNEYVAGNYKDSMGNFAALAAGYGVRTVYLETSQALIDACANEKFAALIFTAPSRRLAASHTDPRSYSAEELAAVAAFNKAGGTVIVAGWSDSYENESNSQSFVNHPDALHMAAAQNELLRALGSSLRIADDATYDDALNGGQAWRLYFSSYNMDNPLMNGIEVDPEHPNDRAYSEVFSQYGGASIYAADAAGNALSALPGTVSPAVFGHAGTYSVDADKDGLGGANVPKYAFAEGDERLLVTASETLDGQGLILVSGAAFMSNFEVQAAASSGASDADTQKNYANYRFCENLVGTLHKPVITPIAAVQAQTEEGYKYTIEGVVTSNASGYDKDTAFFDCIYVQDDTAGICCFPVAGSFQIGDVVRVSSYTDFYQGEAELQVQSIAKVGKAEPVEPAVVSAAQINDRSVQGTLVTVSGKVVRFEESNGLIQTVMVEDVDGGLARVFIDGYITTGHEVEGLSVGCLVTATGLASYDDTFNAPEGPFPRVRVRDRADVVLLPRFRRIGD